MVGGRIIFATSATAAEFIKLPYGVLEVVERNIEEFGEIMQENRRGWDTHERIIILSVAFSIISAPPSGNIVSVTYDADSQTLRVQFKYQDAIYEYPGVDGDTAGGFARALSATQYLKQAIMPISSGERIS